MIQTFKEFLLNATLQKALDDLGFVEPTEIQKKAIPLLLAHAKLIFMVKHKPEPVKLLHLVSHFFKESMFQGAYRKQ